MILPWDRDSAVRFANAVLAMPEGAEPDCHQWAMNAWHLARRILDYDAALVEALTEKTQ